MNYTPPYHITATAVNLIAEISEKIGMLTAFSDNPLHVQLRKKNRIKTIQSSLAIENNTLTIDQITAIIEGKRILGPPKDILDLNTSTHLKTATAEQDDFGKPSSSKNGNLSLPGFP